MSGLGIGGVRYIEKDKYALCYIDTLSDDLKQIIRNELSFICHGSSKASKGKTMYNFKHTVKLFLENYNKKSATTKVGMIGELLTHIFIKRFVLEFKTVSPFFNMEEKHVTKGFDILMYSSNLNELWITEVKSGELNLGKNATQTNTVLLDRAKVDLVKRLNENEISIWHNAINKATLVLEDIPDTKKAVIDILEDFGEEVVTESATSNDKNVILATSLFSKLDNEIQEIDIETFSASLLRSKVFNNLLILSIQKATFDKVVVFLEGEAV